MIHWESLLSIHVLDDWPADEKWLTGLERPASEKDCQI
jgi:hypothetical protein